MMSWQGTTATSPRPGKWLHCAPVRKGAIHWAAAAFLAGFFILLMGISWFYLIPAMQAAGQADDAERRWLAAWSALLLAVLLVLLMIGLIVVFRVRRFFFPRPAHRTRTRHVDAWTESGRRTEPPPR